MKRPHLLRVVAGPAAFSDLVERLAADGLRAGWLDLDAAPAPPAELEEAAAAGVMRAVAVGGGRTLAVKTVRGSPVLLDLLREHFLGCRVVLVRGEVAAPLLEPIGDDWRLTGGSRRRLSTDELAARLRRPAPLE